MYTSCYYFLPYCFGIDYLSYSYASWILHCPSTSKLCWINRRIHTHLKHPSHLFKGWSSGKMGSCFLKVYTASLIRPHKGTLLCRIHTLNIRSLTLVWWFTLASLLRRSSTIWSRPSLLAITNAVWPSCTYKSKKDKPEATKNHTTKQHTYFNLILAWSGQNRTKTYPHNR